MLRGLPVVLVAAAGAFLLAWPLASLRGDERSGFAVAWGPSLVSAAVVAAATALLVARGALAGQRAQEAEGLLARWRERLRGAAGSAGTPPRPWWAPWAFGAVVAALPLAGLRGSYTVLLFETIVFATIAVGLQITIGMAGLLVLGHAAFWAVGAYSFGLLTIHAGWNFWIALPAAGCAAALAGLLIGLPAIRLRGDYLAVVTLGFGEVVRWIIKNEHEWTGGDANLPGNLVRGSFRMPQGWLGEWLWQPAAVYGRPGSQAVQAQIDRECYWFALALLVVCVVCVSRLSGSRIGRALLALREDETAARCMGIDTTRTKLLAFVSSAFWAGISGVVYAVHRGSLNPEMFDFNTSVLFVAMVVLGGLGSIPGAILGAAILWMGPALLVDAYPELQRYRFLFFGALMAAMMVVRPHGLLGRRARPAAKGRQA